MTPPAVRPAAGVSSTIQAAELRRNRPFGAKGEVHYRTVGGTLHGRDAKGGHWIKSAARPGWKRVPHKAVPLYGRVKFGREGRGTVRGASFAGKYGSGAKYRYVRPGRSAATVAIAEAAITYVQARKRRYLANMKAATGYASATLYAASLHAPVIVGGYNWCHLIGHGGGGSDDASNIRAASTHANTEQLLIERIVYGYKRQNVVLRIAAVLFGPGAGRYLATAFDTEVFVNGASVYARRIDGLRAAAPGGAELAAVEAALRSAIDTALSN